MASAAASHPVHVVVANQHGENRGDEAALRAMLTAFEERLGDVRFTILHQFKDVDLRVELPQRVELLPLAPRSAREVAGWIAWLLLGASPRRARVLGPVGRKVVAAYASADLVVSAPGGPYFGDVYRSHELVHWFYVWLASRAGAPAFLYATSAGPYRTRWLAAARRRGFRWFAPPLVVREPVSARHLLELLGPGFPVEVTGDAALQERFPPFARDEWFGSDRAHLRDRFVVAVSAIDFRYPGDPDADARRARYDDTIRRALGHLAARRPCHFVLLPQLYGAAHSDVGYLERLGAGLGDDVSWEICDPGLDSVGQRRVIATADLCLASRYHPQVFAASAHVPGVCIYYEHKALGVMEQLDLARLALDIRTLEPEPLLAAIDDALEHHDELRSHLAEREPDLRARAARTTDLAVEVLRSHAEASH